MRHPGRRNDQPSGLEAAAETLADGATGRHLRWVSQLGLVSRAAIYLLVGYLTLRLALATHARTGEPASATGAVQEATSHVLGQVALGVLAAGFAGYALTQLVEAIFRPGRLDHPVHQWRQRAVSTWGCIVYSAFCVSTVLLLLAVRRPDATAHSEQAQNTAVTSTFLSTGVGRGLLILAGVLVVVGGVEIGRRSVQLTFQERFTNELEHRGLSLLVRALGAFGCGARAAVFVLIGGFLLEAALLDRPRDAKGLDATFRSIAGSDFGTAILFVVALGLISYGLYGLLEARYRDLTPGR